jgi:hypothetical protein
MVRDVMVANTMAENTFQTGVTGVTLSKTNDMEIPVAIVKLMDRMNLFIRFEISAATAADTITVVAGDGPRSGLGDLVCSLDGGAQRVLLGPLESNRFKIMSTVTDKGKIHIDFAGSTIAGIVYAYLIPK